MTGHAQAMAGKPRKGDFFQRVFASCAGLGGLARLLPRDLLLCAGLEVSCEEEDGGLGLSHVRAALVVVLILEILSRRAGQRFHS